MPYKFLTLEGLGRLGTRLKAALTSKTSDESITGQYTFEGDPLFYLDTKAIDDAVLPPGNLRFIDVTNNQEIGDLYLKNTDNLYYDLETAPAVDGYDFVSMEYNTQDEKFDLYYIPLTNPVVTSNSQIVSYINQGIVPNTKNMSTIYIQNTPVTSVPRFYAKNATTLSFYGCTNLISVPEIDMTNLQTFSRCFENCVNLERIPLGISNANITRLYEMFTNCAKITFVPYLNTQDGVDFTEMFNGCSSLEVIQGLNMSAGYHIGDMFKGCTSLREVHIDFGNNTNVSYLFNGLTFGTNQMINLYVKNIPTSARTIIQNNYGAHVTIIDEE